MNPDENTPTEHASVAEPGEAPAAVPDEPTGDEHEAQAPKKRRTRHRAAEDHEEHAAEHGAAVARMVNEGAPAHDQPEHEDEAATLVSVTAEPAAEQAAPVQKFTSFTEVEPSAPPVEADPDGEAVSDPDAPILVREICYVETTQRHLDNFYANGGKGDLAGRHVKIYAVEEHK